MADPNIPGGYRAQCAFQGKSGLPTDQYVTTWAFQGPAVEPNPVAFGQIMDMLEDFWTLPLPSSQMLTNYMSPALVIGPGALTIKVYALSDPLPREAAVREVTVTSYPSTSLPHEVAVCASFYADRNLPKSRGRIYFGPLNNQAITTTPATGRGPTVIQDLQSDLCNAMARLQADSQVGGQGQPAWCVLSQVDQALKEVTAGWVDDALDTVRSRGSEPAGRSTWNA